jgi:hypothetical protein
MAIRTVGELRTALKGLSGSLPVEALDKGSDTRPFKEYRITQVEVGSAGTGQTPPKTVFVEIAPK